MNNEVSSLVEEPIPGSPPPEEKETPKEPGPVGRFFKRFIRWAAAIGLIFASGVVLMLLVRVAPLVMDMRAMREQLATANAQIADLQQTVDDLRDQEQINAALQVDLASSESHIVLLNILADISEARLALALDDPAAANAALTGTDELMAELQASLAGEDANTIVGLRVRLLQAISEIDTDTFAADGDLEILANGLLVLEQKVFSD